MTKKQLKEQIEWLEYWLKDHFHYCWGCGKCDEMYVVLTNKQNQYNKKYKEE